MELFENVENCNFNEELRLFIPIVIKDNKQAYACMCINELFHTLGVIDENDYSVIYAIISDSDIFTEF